MDEDVVRTFRKIVDRHRVPIVLRSLHGPADRVMPGTAAERIAAVGELTCTAWRLAGKPIPDYPREETPVRLLRRTDPRRPGSGE